MAAGALEVVKDDPKFKNVLTYGVDGTAEAMLLIQSGRMTSTSLQNAYDLAAKNISVAHDLLTGKIQQIDTDIDCPLVNKANVEEFIKIHKKSGAIK
jgi:inositol transport system substrate-binding protein